MKVKKERKGRKTRPKVRSKKLSKSMSSKRSPHARRSSQTRTSVRNTRKPPAKRKKDKKPVPQKTSKKFMRTGRHVKGYVGRASPSRRVRFKRHAPKPIISRKPTRSRARAPDILKFIPEKLDSEWNAYLKSLREFQQKATVKNVHDLRVNIRQLMTSLQLTERFNPDNTVRRARITLKDQLSGLSDLRDAHVEMVTIRGYLKQQPELKQFHSGLRDRESGYLNADKKMLSNSNMKFIENAVNRAKVRLSARRATMNISEANKIINDTLDQSFDNVNKKLGYVTTTNYSTIHSVRLAFKPFRYLLETLQPLIPVERKQLANAKSLARIMGQIQDTEVLMKDLAEFKWKKETEQQAVIEIWLDFERRKTESAQRFLKALPNFGKIWKPIIHEQTAKTDSKTLYVLRHGIATIRGDPGYPLDSDRPLTSKGTRKMRQIATGMRRLDVGFDVILTSPYRRALETAFVIGREYKRGETIQTTPALKPEVLPEEVVRMLQDKYASCQNLLLVGHEPQLSAFISTLTSGSAGARPLMKKGGLCKLQIDRLQIGKCATLMWLLTPKQLS
ncbi:MAG TPA: CHAD domain-containing protein, partial [Candidatus Bathyarchaeia archaeon]|nr:CHAD domain-containing protein [Candidatus Bathyarchaeia archaeon]